MQNLTRDELQARIRASAIAPETWHVELASAGFRLPFRVVPFDLQARLSAIVGAAGPDMTPDEYGPDMAYAAIRWACVDDLGHTLFASSAEVMSFAITLADADQRALMEAAMRVLRLSMIAPAEQGAEVAAAGKASSTPTPP